MNKRKGFTLIEVLIVVIILGILATIAIPQFTKMTSRARIAEAWAGLGACRTGQAVYKMENTSYANNAGLLDVSLDCTNFTYTMGNNAGRTDFTAFAQGVAGSAAAGLSAWVTSAGGSGYDATP